MTLDSVEYSVKALWFSSSQLLHYGFLVHNYYIYGFLAHNYYIYGFLAHNYYIYGFLAHNYYITVF
jgi:hypothetical protein